MYFHACPCPYNYARDGSICGLRSAYSRPGSADPLCYPQDVTRQKIKNFKELYYK